jgi:shikimate kinase/nucleoside-diphosphate-sugar epimerase
MARTHLVIGCGYVGSRLAELLHAQGETVVGITHSQESADVLSQTQPFSVRACDVTDPVAVALLAQSLPSPPEVIIHCASSRRGGADSYRAVYLGGTHHLLAAFPAAHFLFTSSTSVYPQTEGELVTEESAAKPDRETSQILRDSEDLILSSHGTVARLAGIYGPARSFVLKSFLEGSASIEGNAGQGRCLNQIHREDAAAALSHLALHPQAGIFNVVDDCPMTQRECFVELSRRFHRPLPPLTEPKQDRKRAWTSKRVSNARLRATGWSPRYATYFEALDQDSNLVPSILDQLPHPGMNIVIIGLMGSGKSSVGKLVAQSLGFAFVDTDHLITDSTGRSVPEIFAAEGEAGFRQRETAMLQSLLGRQRLVISTGGGIVTQPQNLPLLKKLGAVVWLDADPARLHQRIAHSHDRPLLHTADPAATLRQMHEARRPLYKAACDWKITTDDLDTREVAYGLAESARVHFARMQML